MVQEIGTILLEGQPMSLEDVQDIDMGAKVARLLQIAEASKHIPQKGLKWVMPTDTGLKWMTQDGKIHTKDLW